MREQLFPDLHTSDGIGNRGVRHAVPLNREERHSVGEGHVREIGRVLMSVADELVCTATGLSVQPFSLAVGLVNVFDVTVIGRNAVCYKIITIGKNSLDLGNKIVQEGRVRNHVGGDAVYLLGVLPLFLVSGLHKGVHNNASLSVADRDRNDLVVIVKACQLKVEEENAAAVHSVVCVSVSVTLLAADSKILLVAGATELFLVAHVFSTLNAVKRQTERRLFVIEIECVAIALGGKSGNKNVLPDFLVNRLCLLKILPEKAQESLCVVTDILICLFQEAEQGL